MSAIDLDVTDEEAGDVIVAAVEGGSGYWADFRRYEPDEGRVQLRRNDERGAPWIIVTHDDIRRGMSVAGKLYPHQLAKWLRDRIGDAEQADVFLQCAALGEIVYS